MLLGTAFHKGVSSAWPKRQPRQHRSVHPGYKGYGTGQSNSCSHRPPPPRPLLPGAFFLSAETSCEVVPIEDAAVAAFAGRRTAREGAGGDAVAKVHAWQGMPSVVSWTAQAVGACRAWLPVRPFYLGTERDHVCEEKWRPSYRCILIKK